jgi:antitoxin component YwqK of YwqJK toxin-antitoxin module
MKKIIFLLLVCVCVAGLENIWAQCKTFKLSDRGDTLNCVDRNGLKQGPWLVQVAELRGNPGYEEEGEFIDDKKEGIWRRYTMEGDMVAVESYKWGMLNGKSQFYSVLGLEREEGWWAINPKKKYDTIEVPDLFQDGVYKSVVIKNEGRSFKHGTWTWYDPTTGFVQRTEEFIRDSSVNPLDAFGISARSNKKASDTATTKKKTEKPAVVQEYEKNNAKKKIKVRDGSTGY